MDIGKETADQSGSGFYKWDGNELLYAPNFVYGKNYELKRGDKVKPTPVDGWRWFETRQEALDGLGLEEKPIETELAKVPTKIAQKESG